MKRAAVTDSVKISCSRVLITLFLVMTTNSVVAEPDKNSLIIEGVTIKTDAVASEDSLHKSLFSGWRFRNSAIQGMQREDIANPGFLAVDLGRSLWVTSEGTADKSCADCHQSASGSMRGVRATMPRWDTKAAKPQTLEMQINQCRINRMQAQAWPWESEQMIGMTAWIGLQSRGMPVKVNTEGPIAAWVARGKEIYQTHYGQLNMACKQCHLDHFGKLLRGDHLSQGHINGHPIYHSASGTMQSIHRRFAICMIRFRAEPYKIGGDEFLALESYIASLGNGLAVETPSVR